MSKPIPCPRISCNNEAIENPLYGILPCQSCQDRDAAEDIGEPIQYITIEKSNRIHKNWDRHNKDILQPYDAHGKPNPEFVRAYPEKRSQYYTNEQLSKI